MDMERAVVRVIRIFEYGIQQAVGRKPLPCIRRAELEVFYRCGLLLPFLQGQAAGSPDVADL